MATASILFYDGSCGLCRSIVRWIARRRRAAAVRPVAIHDPARMAGFPQIDHDEANRSVILLAPDGLQEHGYSAAVGVLEVLGVPRWALRLLRWPPVAALGNAVYRWVTRRRHRISRVLGLR